jgi:hypothetical protein
MLQAVGAPMNGQLFAFLQNKWLASAVTGNDDVSSRPHGLNLVRGAVSGVSFGVGVLARSSVATRLKHRPFGYDSSKIRIINELDSVVGRSKELCEIHLLS